jgi:uncharacterized protein (DUF2062 family)
MPFIKALTMIKKWWNSFKNILLGERQPTTIIRSLVIGTFLAFSPFMPLQTWLGILFGWFLGANIPIIIGWLYLINNPLTLIPIMLADYLFGIWLTNLFNINLKPYDPALFSWLSTKMSSWLGIPNICFWCYIIGGTALATLITLASYPIIKKSIYWWFKKSQRHRPAK